MSIDALVGGDPPRYVVVHYHIFKNGGSTLESIFEREFPGRFASLHGPTPDAVLGENHLAEFLRDNPDICALTSHHLCYPKPIVPGIIVFDCCFLRHPLDRAHSIYTYLRKAASLTKIAADDPLGRLAQRLSAADFVKALADRWPHLISDVQTHRLANAGAFTRPANDADLEKATRILLDMSVPGVLGLFDESLVAAEYFLRPAFPGIRLEYVRQNASVAFEANAAKNEGDWVRRWGTSLYEEIARLNQFDLELYRRGVREIERRLSYVPRFSERIEDFRSRCAAYAAAPSANRRALPIAVGA
jgi:hypothetical protein